MIIGITGGTGSGKTTVLNLLRDAGALVLDCDEIYHRLLQTDTAMLQAISQRFPGSVTDGQLNRKKLGAVVFSDKAALLDLNRITHSAVKKEVISLLSAKPKLAAIDAIGLFESGLAELCQITIAVTAPIEDRVKRLMARDHICEAYAKSRIAAQPSAQAFSALCDYTLENNGTQAEFHTKCLAFFQKIGII